MLKKRIIPCLLLEKQGLVKTVQFSNPKYVGDPINAVRIFNDKEVDELVFLDISASRDKRKPDFELLSRIAKECFMPLGYGGGITCIQDIRQIFSLGVEKVVINSSAGEDPAFIREAVAQFGSQSIVVSIDVKRHSSGEYGVYTFGGRKMIAEDPVTYALRMEECGVGEIFLNSIDLDGTMKGYDVSLIHKVASRVKVPLIACGGAGKIEDFRDAIKNGGASACAAGSMFVFHGKFRAVLISYPEINVLENLLNQ